MVPSLFVNPAYPRASSGVTMFRNSWCDMLPYGTGPAFQPGPRMSSIVGLSPNTCTRNTGRFWSSNRNIGVFASAR